MMDNDRGAFVALVGPDGVGKTSVAAEIISRTGGRYFHFRPPLRRRWSSPTPGETIKGQPQHQTGRFLSALRRAKALAVFWLGYLASVRPEVDAGKLVVADRWAYGYLVHPAKLGVSESPRLATTMLRMMPQPDMVFALVADPITIHARKQELSTEQAAIEVRAWASLPISRIIQVDANESVARIADTILGHLDRA